MRGSQTVHTPKHYTEVSRLVAGVCKRDWDGLTAELSARLTEDLSVIGTLGSHVDGL